MSDQLRDAIAAELRRYCYEGDDDRYAAEDVLDLPELQAIRKALYRATAIIAYRDDPTPMREVLTDGAIMGNLPPSVVAWVLDGQP